MTKPEYIMMVGLPGSGKSTMINKLKNDNPDKDYKVVSSDDIIEEMGKKDGLTYKESFDKYAKKAMKEMNKRFDNYVDSGYNIIHDQTNLNVKTRKGKLQKVQDYEKNVIAFELEEDELIRRQNQRKEDTGKMIPEYIIKLMRSSYERPTVDEGFVRVLIIKK